MGTGSAATKSRSRHSSVGLTNTGDYFDAAQTGVVLAGDVMPTTLVVLLKLAAAWLRLHAGRTSA